jgi:hypothetical protein
MCKKWSWPNLMCDLGMCLEGLRNYWKCQKEHVISKPGFEPRAAFNMPVSTDCMKWLIYNKSS